MVGGAGAGGKTSIKGTVKYVCALLAAVGIEHLTPELVRRAKFNTPGLARRLLAPLRCVRPSSGPPCGVLLRTAPS